MKRHLTIAALAAALGLGATGSASAVNITTSLFSENFNGLTLGPSVNERVSNTLVPVVRAATDANSIPYTGVFSKTAPGWSVDNNFNAFGDFNLAYDPDSNMDGSFNVNAQGGASNTVDSTPPVGTILGNVGVANAGSAANGVDEWEGWGFADKNWWITVAEDQDRSQFTLGTGTVAIVDPDEYDDLGTGRGGGYYNSGLSTPSIDLSGADGGFLGLTFDSSFLPEAFDDDNTTNPGLLGGNINNQTIAVWATYGGTNARTERVFIGDSDGGNTNLADGPIRPASPTLENNTNTTKTVGLSLLAGDTDVQLTFGMMNAANDWWWAVDNIKLEDGLATPLFTEDFEGVTLGDSINERQGFSRVTQANDAATSSPRPDSFTKTTPAGWDVVTTAGPGVVGDNNQGVYEWEGWGFTDLDFWNFADLQGRQNFAKADGVFAVVDGDEWDDLNNPEAGGPVDSAMTTPTFSIAGVDPGQLFLQFDSSWRTEDPQFAEVLVDYHDGNGPQLAFRFDGTTFPSATFDSATAPSVSQTLLVPLSNPAGATMASLSFRYNGTDDWWWAIDNIRVGTVPEPTSIALIVMASAGLGLVRRRK